MEGNTELLHCEFTELNTYVRNDVQLTMAWYTFFLTVNFVAIGWFTSVLLTGNLKASLPIIFICVFFVVQLCFSYLGLAEVRKYFRTAYDRCNHILTLLSADTRDPQLQPKAAMPIDVYSNIFALFQITFISFVFFWVALLAVALYLVPL